MRATVSTRGQVTIPEPLRDQLGIRPGDVMEFKVDGQRLILTRGEQADLFIEALGILDLPASTDQMVDDLRGV